MGPEAVREPLLERVAASLRAGRLGAADRLVVGFSGGVDSLVLLHLLSRLHAVGRGPLPLPVHVDHGLRAESAADAELARALGATLDLTVEFERVDVGAWNDVGAGVEAAARAARYAALAGVARAAGAGWLAVAHNLDDQAETVYLRLLRGGGLGGLSAMRPISRRSVPLAPGGESVQLSIIRPLLGTRRAEIEAYAATHGLQPVEDPSNTSLDYTRNRVRHQLLPLAESIAPGAARIAARTAELLSGEVDLLERLTDEAAPAVLSREGELTQVRREPLLALHPALQRRILLRATRGDEPAEPKTFERVEALRQALRAGSRATIELGGGQAARIDSRGAWIGPSGRLGELIRAASGLPLLPAMAQPFTGERLALGNGWQLELSAGAGWCVRGRKPGDRLRLADGRLVRLQDWLVNRKVPAETRNRLPLLVKDDIVYWVAGVGSQSFRLSGEGGSVEARLRRIGGAGAQEG